MEGAYAIAARAHHTPEEGGERSRNQCNEHVVNCQTGYCRASVDAGWYANRASAHLVLFCAVRFRLWPVWTSLESTVPRSVHYNSDTHDGTEWWGGPWLMTGWISLNFVFTCKGLSFICRERNLWSCFKWYFELCMEYETPWAVFFRWGEQCDRQGVSYQKKLQYADRKTKLFDEARKSRNLDWITQKRRTTWAETQ